MRMVTLFLLLTACSRSPWSSKEEQAAKPPVALISRLEARLGKEPCVHSLDHWRRRYRYSAFGGKTYPNKQRIWIEFTVAGYHGEAAGMSIEPPPPEGVIELNNDETDRPEAAYGEYDVRRNVIRWWCDANDRSDHPQSLFLKV